jgi:hypothetical protein
VFSSSFFKPKPTQQQVSQFCQMGKKSLLEILGDNPNEQRLFFITLKHQTNRGEEISEHVLFRYLIKEISNPFLKETF